MDIFDYALFLDSRRTLMANYIKDCYNSLDLLEMNLLIIAPRIIKRYHFHSVSLLNLSIIPRNN